MLALDDIYDKQLASSGAVIRINKTFNHAKVIQKLGEFANKHVVRQTYIYVQYAKERYWSQKVDNQISPS